MTWAEIIMAVVLVQRLCELWYAQRNTRELLAEGAVEHGAEHYPFVIMVHAAWLASLLFLIPPETPPDFVWLGVYVALQAARAWVMVSLGRFWTTRVITLPGRPLMARGPYRFIRHPNYVVVALEIFVLPMVFGALWIALVFSALNAAVLYERLRVENAALAGRSQLTPES